MQDRYKGGALGIVLGIVVCGGTVVLEDPGPMMVTVMAHDWSHVSGQGEYRDGPGIVTVYFNSDVFIFMHFRKTGIQYFESMITQTLF